MQGAGVEPTLLTPNVITIHDWAVAGERCGPRFSVLPLHYPCEGRKRAEGAGVEPAYLIFQMITVCDGPSPAKTADRVLALYR